MEVSLARRDVPVWDYLVEILTFGPQYWFLVTDEPAPAHFSGSASCSTASPNWAATGGIRSHDGHFVDQPRGGCVEAPLS